MNFWHYTCEHGRQAIGDAGRLIPPIRLADPSTYAKWPAWRKTILDIIWLTDLDTPERAALGLTSNTIGCDRTVHRYRVTGFMPLRYASCRRDLPKRLRDDLENAPGVLPMHWWFAYTPVPVVYDPIRREAAVA